LSGGAASVNQTAAELRVFARRAKVFRSALQERLQRRCRELRLLLEQQRGGPAHKGCGQRRPGRNQEFAAWTGADNFNAGRRHLNEIALRSLRIGSAAGKLGWPCGPSLPAAASTTIPRFTA